MESKKREPVVPKEWEPTDSKKFGSEMKLEVKTTSKYRRKSTHRITLGRHRSGIVVHEIGALNKAIVVCIIHPSVGELNGGPALDWLPSEPKIYCND